ncbi:MULTISPECIES: hypothetical protein [Vitreoscilla]|uniref:WG repeat-containing protein n=1 Tax=Vitreoscilla stercoraria TaxID=61 RepID=A0ABY4ED04_VITST|nr:MULTISPECIES: hypothetical protein [Vitreoscilla]UOO92523.1 hypothetical protein LVJ81_00245 [Vitreoscilla stercoraria]
MNKWAAVLAICCVSSAWADGLYIHQQASDAEQCYLTNQQGQRLFEGHYQTDCYAIRPHLDMNEAQKYSQNHAVLNMFEFRGQQKVAINAQGRVVYHLYWYDNGPDYVEDGLVRIRNAQGLIGYADAQTGQIVIAPQYFCAQPFENGKALVGVTGRLEQEDGWDGEICVPEPALIIDKTGRLVR